jgi:hypothetical protein
MSRVLRLLVVCCLGFAFVGEGQARAQGEVQTKLAAFLQSPRYKAFVSRDLAHLPSTVFNNCAGLVSGSSQITIIEPISFDQSGVPTNGRWRHAFPVRGCGNDTVLNFFFMIESNGQLGSVVGLPGTTLADLVLEHDALTYAMTAAGFAVKPCASFEVTNTRFEAYGLAHPETPDPGTDARFRPWWEMWTLVGCERTLDVPMNFVPDSTGTQVTPPGNIRVH